MWLDKSGVLKTKCSETCFLIGFGFIYIAACISDAGGEWAKFLHYIYKGVAFLGISIVSHIYGPSPFRGWFKVVRTWVVNVKEDIAYLQYHRYGYILHIPKTKLFLCLRATRSRQLADIDVVFAI